MNASYVPARLIRRLFVKVRRPRPDRCWWPNRRGFTEELEAET